MGKEQNIKNKGEWGLRIEEYVAFGIIALIFAGRTQNFRRQELLIMMYFGKY